MTEEIEPKEIDRTPIKAPKIVCTDLEAKQILEGVGMAALKRKGDDAPPDIRAPELADLLKLGAFVEGSGVVPLDHGAILITRQVMLRQMVRLESKAQELTALEDIKDITYAMGYLGTQIGRISTIGIKTKVAAEEAAEELRKKKQPSWQAGAMVQAQAGSTVHLHQPPNGVAAAPLSA